MSKKLEEKTNSDNEELLLDINDDEVNEKSVSNKKDEEIKAGESSGGKGANSLNIEKKGSQTFKRG